MYVPPTILIINLYKSLDKIINEIPLIANRQCAYIPTPIPNAALMPSFLPKMDICLRIIAVSGPGLVNAIRCAKADQRNIG